MRRKPGTDTKFPAQFAGNWLSVPGFAPRDMLPIRRAPKTVKYGKRAGSLVARAFVGDLGTDGAASEFPAKGAGNPWQSRRPRVRGDLGTDGAASEFPAKGAENPWQSRRPRVRRGPEDRRGCQRISGKRRRKSMAVSALARSSGHPGTDGAASEFPAKGAENPWQSRRPRVRRGPGDRRGCQRISGKRRRKSMAVSSVPGQRLDQ